MYNVTEGYKAAIAAKTVTYRWYGTITFTDGVVVRFDHENVDQNKSRLTRQCVKGENLEIGSCFAGELILGLRDSASWNISDKKYNYTDSTVVLKFQVYNPSTSVWEAEVLCGTFIVTKAERTYHTVTLTAYDDINKLNEKLEATFTGKYTPYDAIQAICSLANVTFGMTRAQVEAFPSGQSDDLNLGLYKVGATYKKIIGDICTILGANAICDRYNRLVLLKLNTTPVRTIGAENRYSSSYMDYIGHYTTFYYAKKNGEVLTASAGTPSPRENVRELAMNVGKNTLMEDFEDSKIYLMFIAMSIMTFYEIYYSPCNVTMPSDPAIDVGDMVSLVGGEISGSYIRSIDTSVVPNRVYYEASQPTYTVVVPKGDENPAAKGWYIYNDVSGTYIKTSSVIVDPSQTYYIKSAGYSVVTPSAGDNPSEEEWYVVGNNVICTKIEMPLYGQMKITSQAGTYELEINEYSTENKQEQQEQTQDIDNSITNIDNSISTIDNSITNIDNSITNINNGMTDLGNDVSDLQDAVSNLSGKTAVQYIFPYQIISGGISDGGNAYALRFRFKCDRDGDTVAFYAMFSFLVSTTGGNGTYGDCNLTVQYLLDDSVVSTATHTYGDGNAILTLNGCLSNPTAGEHLFDVKFALSGGSIS